MYIHIYTIQKKWFHIAYTARLPAFITLQHLVNNFPCQQLCFYNIKTDCPTPSRPTDRIPISRAKWFGALFFALAAPTPALFSSSLRLSIMPHLPLPWNWGFTSNRILSGQLTQDPWIHETTSTEPPLRGRNETDCWERKEGNWHDCNCREQVLGAFAFTVMSPSRRFHVVGVSSSIFIDVQTKCEGNAARNNPKSLWEPHAALTLQRENCRLQHWCSGPNTARTTAPQPWILSTPVPSSQHGFFGTPPFWCSLWIHACLCEYTEAVKEPGKETSCFHLMKNKLCGMELPQYIKGVQWHCVYSKSN